MTPVLGIFAFFAFGALMLGLLIAVGVYVYRMDKKRIEAFMVQAPLLGLSYDTEGAEPELSNGGYELFQRGRARKFRHLMRRNQGDNRLLVSDYQYTTGSGKNTQTHSQTIAAFFYRGASLPFFTLSPENFFHKIATAFGYQDIDFPEDPEFSKRWLLRGRDEAAVREFAGIGMRASLSACVGWSIEVGGEYVIVYRQNKQIAPEELAGFLTQAQAIAEPIAGPLDAKSW